MFVCDTVSPVMVLDLCLGLQLIPPRGCAYVCLSLRRDAARALDRLRGAKLMGNTLKVSAAAAT